MTLFRHWKFYWNWNEMKQKLKTKKFFILLKSKKMMMMMMTDLIEMTSSSSSTSRLLSTKSTTTTTTTTTITLRWFTLITSYIDMDIDSFQYFFTLCVCVICYFCEWIQKNFHFKNIDNGGNKTKKNNSKPKKPKINNKFLS